jgi:hypothetical protein
MSLLQKSLLKEGLWAYYRTPLDKACQLDNPGCFGLKTMMTDFEDRRVRASPACGRGALHCAAH